jgi:hypothetical protein
VWQCFFHRHGIGPMADDGHHGKGEHDERDMPVPTVPGACLVVIETEFVFGGFEAVLNGPAMTFDRDELFQGRALGAPCGEEGQIAVGDIAADQETPRPLTYEGAIIFASIEIGQFEIGPVMQARPFGSFA